MPLGARPRSLTAQTLTYFSRPHAGPPPGPLKTSAAWRGDELAADPERWREALAAAEIAELEAVAGGSEGLPLERLRRRDVPLPRWAPRLSRWRRELGEGRGFVVASGLPVERWGAELAGRAFWILGLHLGVPGAQNQRGDVLGHVLDTGESADDQRVRLYRTRAEIAYHCDAADVVGLLCLRQARRGGQSRIASSVSVFNRLLAERPDLAPLLFEPIEFDTRGDGGVRHVPVPPCRYFGGTLRTFYHSDYFRSAWRYPDVGEPEPALRELLDRYEAIAAEPSMALEMDLRPGDIQLLSNHVVLHGRSGYEDDADPGGRRHLLRLWLSLDERRGAAERLSRLKSAATLVAHLARARLRG